MKKNMKYKDNYFYFLLSLSLVVFVGVGCKSRSSKKQSKKFVQPSIEIPVDPPENTPGNASENTPGSTSENTPRSTSQTPTLGINASLPPISSSNAETYTVSGTCNSNTNESVSIVIETPKTTSVEVPCNSNVFTGTTDARKVISKEATIRVTHENEKTSTTVANNIIFPDALELSSLLPLSSTNMNQYIISGTCKSSLGNVTIVIGKPNVEKDLPCDSRNTFLGVFNVEDVSSHPTAIKASQSEGKTVTSSVDNNINIFVTKWKFPDNFQFTIPLRRNSSLIYNFTVDWGDGSSSSEVTSFDDSDKVHTYQSAGTYTVKIQGICEGFTNASDSTRNRLLEVLNLGNMGWEILSEAFKENRFLLNVFGGNTSNVTTMYNLFSNASRVNPDTSGWDTSNVTDMRGMFDHANNANPDTSGWDTSKVSSMRWIFSRTTNANPNTSGWDTSNVTDMSGMFKDATSANPDTSGWDTSSVTDMRGMFEDATSANPNTSNWNTSRVTDMRTMFDGATRATPNTSNWNTSNVTDMRTMFEDATSANPDVSGWDTSRVESMFKMFYRAGRANPNTSGWDFRRANSSVNQMFLLSGLSATNYSKFLIEFDRRTPSASDKNMNMGTLKYDASGVTARTSLRGKGWSITDGGPGQ